MAVHRHYKVRGAWIRTKGQVRAKNAKICVEKCNRWNVDRLGRGTTSRFPDDCVAVRWRHNNKKYRYKARRRCWLLKSVGEEIKSRGWSWGMATN